MRTIQRVAGSIPAVRSTLRKRLPRGGSLPFFKGWLMRRYIDSEEGAQDMRNINFMEGLRQKLDSRIAYTENGAARYVSGGSALVDLNFSVASLRQASEQEIISRFIRAYYEDRVLAVKWLFFARDVRGGLGERRLFRVILRHLSVSEPRLVDVLVDLVAEYGRYDDLLCLFGTPGEGRAMDYIAEQLSEDRRGMEQGKPISLCAKWMPGNNTSSPQARNMAAALQRHMKLTAREYRRLLSSLRAYLGVTEVSMSANAWEEIDYAHVPSRANLVYQNAFLRHDADRRRAYISAACNEGAVMHAGTLMPHEIAVKYSIRRGWQLGVGEENITLEALWKNLKDTVQGAKNVLCVVDGSGSMLCEVGGNGIAKATALHVSNALGIYFSERMKGAYRNKFITFSSRPEYVDLSGCRTLREKLALAFSYDDCSNTDIEATFELILETAVEQKLSQQELPGTVLIISDMEFDAAVMRGKKETLFGEIQELFALYGYRMPRLVFWNVNSRTNVVPVRENELGVALVSGFSVNICNMVLSGELEPYACLKKVLDSKRYLEVERRLKAC